MTLTKLVSNNNHFVITYRLYQKLFLTENFLKDILPS